MSPMELELTLAVPMELVTAVTVMSPRRACSDNRARGSTTAARSADCTQSADQNQSCKFRQSACRTCKSVFDLRTGLASEFSICGLDSQVAAGEEKLRNKQIQQIILIGLESGAILAGVARCVLLALDHPRVFRNQA